MNRYRLRYLIFSGAFVVPFSVFLVGLWQHESFGYLAGWAEATAAWFIIFLAEVRERR
jgi:hypothetical protein